jgi:hemerythrin
MAKIKWNENMSVGVKVIDYQHKTLIEAINGFYEVVGNISNKELIGNMLKKMKDYSAFHFNYEEQLLKKHGYPQLPYHKIEHKNFIDKVEDLNDRFMSGKLVISLEITSFIESWITKHIMATDKQYGAFLNAKGLV